jgi:hypothetical protein
MHAMRCIETAWPVPAGLGEDGGLFLSWRPGRSLRALAFAFRLAR